MKSKKTAGMISIILILLFLSSCGKSQFMDLSGFIFRFNKRSEESLSFEDFYLLEKGENIIYEGYFPKEKPRMILNLNSEADGISSVKLSLVKSKEPIDEETKKLFLTFSKSMASSFCDFKKEKTEALFEEFGLKFESDLTLEGELTKNENQFHFVYYSNAFVSEFVIYNTYLKPVEPTEKPVSKPAFGMTNNLRNDEN